MLDGNKTDFKVLVRYRKDDESSWTVATTGNNTQTVIIGGLDVDFYKLQVRVTLTDDTGYNQDIRISAINVTVSEPR